MTITEGLDSEGLSNCRFVGKTWKSFIDQGKVQAGRIVKRYTSIDENNLGKFIKRINTDKAIELATTVKNIYQCFPQSKGNLINRNIFDSSPLHQAARSGHLLLCKLIIENVGMACQETLPHLNRGDRIET